MTSNAGDYRNPAAATGMGSRRFLLVLMLSAALLAARIPSASLWIDELFTVQVAGEPSLPAVVQHAIETERRPPLHYVTLHLWSGLLGADEPVQRALSIVFLLLALPLIFALGRRLGDERVAWWSALLTVASPFLVLLGPMVRAYSLTLLLGCLATFLLYRWIDRPSRRSWPAYVAAALALVYTDYVGLALVLGHALLVPRPARRGMLAAFAVLLLAYLPWLGVVLAQMGRPVLPADFARSLPGYALKVVYPFYSYALGETIFPWHPLAIAGGLAVVVLALSACRFWWRRPAALLGLVLLAGVPLAFTVVLLSTFATDITFLNVGSRTAIAVPYVYIFLAGGISRMTDGWSSGSLRRTALRWAPVAALATAWCASLANLFLGNQYHNPIYALPMRQAVQEVLAAARPGDVVAADPDAVFDYYLARAGAGLPILSSITPTTLPSLQAAPPPRVWLVTLGRDRTRELEPVALIAWLEQSYQTAAAKGYVPQDTTYGEVKRRLLGRDAYQYKVLVRLFAKSQ